MARAQAVCRVRHDLFNTRRLLKTYLFQKLEMNLDMQNLYPHCSKSLRYIIDIGFKETQHRLKTFDPDLVPELIPDQII